VEKAAHHRLESRKNTGVQILESPGLDNNPGQNGVRWMYSKVLIMVVCALAMAIVVHSLVYLSIDAASLSAEMRPSIK
jgi:hypothetical protein